jgi:tetratricopeptide (TPR) repeat protein
MSGNCHSLSGPIRTAPPESRPDRPARGRILTGRWLFPFLMLWAMAAGAGRAEAQTATNSYDVAQRLFQTAAYDLAEKELAAFIAANPNAPQVPDALLFQAQARYQLKNPDGALALLRAGQNAAGSLADQYAYWIGEALFQNGQYAEAAQAFAKMLADHPASSRQLEAAVGEAFACFRLGDARRTADLLRRPDGAFQSASGKRPDDELTVRGLLLHGEASLILKEYAAGEEALKPLAGRALPPETDGPRQFLLARLQAGGQHLDAGLATLAGLLGQLSTATNTAVLALKAEAVALQGELLERKGQAEAAVKAYEQNLEPSTPATRHLEAVQQLVRLALAAGRTDEAAGRLETFLRQAPAGLSADELRLTLGELRLKQYYATAEPERASATNLLDQARLQFSTILSNVHSPVLAVAHLNRGWCLWEASHQGALLPLIQDAVPDFQAAAERLPLTEPQALARFKLADCQFLLGQYAAAVSNYWQVVTHYAALSAVTNSLVPEALYQINRAAIQTGDLDNANRAVERLLSGLMEGGTGERSLLLFGQAVSRLRTPAEGRQVFADWLKRFPESPLAPEVGLAIVRAYQREENWAEAAAECERWLARHPDHGLRPRAEFERALTTARAGNEPNAYVLFTNFTARFSTDDRAPWAQHWVADYHFNHQRYDQAELDYQKLFQSTNWPVSELTYQARLNAGRAAFQRQGYAAARGYFTNLLNDATCPAALQPEVWFELGNTLIEDKPSTSTNLLANYVEAIAAFSKIPQNFTNSRFAPLAWGQIGHCYLQLGSADSRQYDQALECYRNLLKSETADIASRSEAQVGVATALKRKAEKAAPAERVLLVREAQKAYLSVVTGDLLRPNEVSDVYWVAWAAKEGARLAEQEKWWDEAVRLYQRLIEVAPQLQEIWKARLEDVHRLREQTAP